MSFFLESSLSLSMSLLSFFLPSLFFPASISNLFSLSLVFSFRKGLLHEDLIMEELPGVKEALRRLPQDVVDARYFRIKRVSV